MVCSQVGQLCHHVHHLPLKSLIAQHITQREITAACPKESCILPQNPSCTFCGPQGGCFILTEKSKKSWWSKEVPDFDLRCWTSRALRLTILSRYWDQTGRTGLHYIKAKRGPQNKIVCGTSVIFVRLFLLVAVFRLADGRCGTVYSSARLVAASHGRVERCWCRSTRSWSRGWHTASVHRKWVHLQSPVVDQGQGRGTASSVFFDLRAIWISSWFRSLRNIAALQRRNWQAPDQARE